jgi:hypothetical protein
LNVSKSTNGSALQQQKQAHAAAGGQASSATKDAPAPSKPAAEASRKNERLSTMNDVEVMAKLKKIVTKYDPLKSYQKQKKIGQGASGSVYIAKVLVQPTCPVAQMV